MSNDRFFSDSIKLEVIKNNLRNNDGTICCTICNKRLNSIEECHFDHIYPFAKGGKSSLDNCQILCSNCNLSKNDKELQDFILEDKARKFLAGKELEDKELKVQSEEDKGVNDKSNKGYSKKLSKEKFDEIIGEYIERKGDIHKVDFTRKYNKLPSIWYVHEYYGDLNTMKKAFGIEDLSLNWTREKIKEVLMNYVYINGNVSEKDLKRKNGLPSYPCILKYYSEYASFSLFKKEVLGIKDVYRVWTKDEILDAGKEFVKSNGKLTEKDLKAKNGLPTSKVIYHHFGTLNAFQREIGAPLTDSNTLITREEIEKAVDMYFGNRERVVESRKSFFETFSYKPDIIYKRYGSIEEFCSITGIIFLSVKKASYLKKEIDDAIHKWIFSGNDIPKAKELTQNGLPSRSSIMKYYENWKEPFILYKRIFDEANRNNG